MALLRDFSKTSNRIVETVFPFLHQDLRRTKTHNQLLRMELEERPTIDELLAEHPQLVLPYMPYRYEDVQQMVWECSVLRRCITTLRQEIFRRGFDEPQPKFAFKCTKCGEEYNHKPKGEICDVENTDEETGLTVTCGGSLREPSRKQLKRAKKIIEKPVNKNGQRLLEVYKQLEDDVNTYDDQWLVARKTYDVDERGNIIDWTVEEYIRAPPRYIRYIADDKGYLGGKYSVCLLHRETPIEFVEGRAQKCPECGRKTYNVIAAGIGRGEESAQEYYIDGEVFHQTKYSSSLLYGFSPVATLWKKSLALVYMESYIEESYRKRRAPSGILAFATKNAKSLESWWKEQQRAIQRDPLHIPVAAIESENGKGAANFVSFLQNLQEMQYGDVRKEFKEEIGATLGVMPIFQGDLSTSGGLNNEGLQITVGNRAIELGQQAYNEFFTPVILALEGITDWELPLLPSEEEDEAAELQRRGQEIANAQGLANLGFDVDMKEDGELVFEKIEPSITKPESPLDGGLAGGINLNPSMIGGEAEQVSGTPDSKHKAEPPAPPPSYELDEPLVKILKSLAPSDYPIEVEIEDADNI